jgi:hypothetical protein
MKKLLVTAATVALSIAPAAAVHADTTSIDATQDQSYKTAAHKDSGTDTSVEQYSNKTVNYEAMYYVNYNASQTDMLKATTSKWDNSHVSSAAHNNYMTSFNNMLGGWGGQHGGSHMGGGWSHEN